MGFCDAGVVDEDRGHADVGADALCYSGHCGRVGDVAFIEVDKAIYNRKSACGPHEGAK